MSTTPLLAPVVKEELSALEDDTDILREYDDDECVLCADNAMNYLDEFSELKTAACGHRFCTACTQRQFQEARQRSFACPVPGCKNQVRKANLRRETKRELDYQKEIAIRGDIMKEFGRERDAFPDTPAYDDYLEEVETLIFDKVSGKNTARVEERIKANRRENKAAIDAYQARRAARALRDEALIVTHQKEDAAAKARAAEDEARQKREARRHARQRAQVALGERDMTDRDRQRLAAKREKRDARRARKAAKRERRAAKREARKRARIAQEARESEAPWLMPGGVVAPGAAPAGAAGAGAGGAAPAWVHPHQPQPVDASKVGAKFSAGGDGVIKKPSSRPEQRDAGAVAAEQRAGGHDAEAYRAARAGGGGAGGGGSGGGPAVRPLAEVLRKFPVLAALGLADANDNELSALGIQTGGGGAAAD